MSLSAEQLRQFHTDGIITLGPVLTREQCADAKQRFWALRKKGVQERDLFEAKPNEAKQSHIQMINVFRHDDFFKGLLYRADLLDRVRQVLGPHVMLFHDQVFYKPAGNGGPTPWHQDNAYWKCQPADLASIWITFDDVDLENSCLWFAPRTHREPPPPQRHAEGGVGDLLVMDIDEGRLKPYIMHAGEAAMHHCNTVHGAKGNQSNRDRLSFAIHYMRAGILGGDGKRLEISEDRPLLCGKFNF